MSTSSSAKLWLGMRVVPSLLSYSFALEPESTRQCGDCERGLAPERLPRQFTVYLIGTEVQDLMAARLKTRGTFCAEWLGRCSTTKDGWLIDRKGTKYDLSKARIANGTSELRHIVQWTWIQRGRVRFDYVPGYHSATAPSLRAFQRLCSALLYNFLQLLYGPKSPTLLTQYNNEIARHHEWHLTSTGDIQHYDATILIATHTARTSDGWDAWASKDVSMAEKVQFMAHPASSRLVQLWGGERRWQVSRHYLKKHISKRRSDKGRDDRDKCINLRHSTAGASSALNEGLKGVTWKKVHRVPGTNAYERQLFYRVKAGKVSTWNRRDGNKACCEEECDSSSSADINHIFWEYPSAQQERWPMLDAWERIGLEWKEPPEQAIFSLNIPDEPKWVWRILQEKDESNHVAPNMQDYVFQAVNLIWQYTCVAIIAGIWRRRNNIIAGDAQCDQYKGARLGPRLRSRLNNLWKLIQAGSSEEAAQNEAAMVMMIGALLIDNQCEIVERCPTPMALYILFFDGGSRGNPGPGGSGSGSGSVILRINPALRQALMVWVASMAYSHPSTTNNVAEYWSLINGLQYAQARNHVPLHVVGDSAMIIKQQQSHHPPKNAELVKLYHRSKRLADTMSIRSWKHHYRAHNKVTDLAANHAMNTKSSAQYAFPTTRPTGNEIEQLMSKDVTHWFDRFGDGTSWLGATDFDLLTSIRVYLQPDHLDRQLRHSRLLAITVRTPIASCTPIHFESKLQKQCS